MNKKYRTFSLEGVCGPEPPFHILLWHVRDMSFTLLPSRSCVDSLQRLRGYTYTCRLRDGTLHLVTP
eukprot:COSAG01_NODE_33901_length_556_cov_3.269147_2_plen_66_part_01